MRQPNLSPFSQAGHYVAAADWNALIAEPGTIVIETRNDCEVEAGTFEGAIDLKTKTFRAFPAWFNSQRSRLLGEETPSMIAIFFVPAGSAARSRPRFSKARVWTKSIICRTAP